MKAKISAISYYLPEKTEGSIEWNQENPDWLMPKIIAKTGIEQCHISADAETAVDMAISAGKNLLNKISSKEDIDLLILVTQSPDYVLPTSACIVQDRLELSQCCMSFDMTLGCSGFVYALSVATSLMETRVANKAVIICADTYTKYIAKDDRTCRTIFSDGAAAVLLEKNDVDSIGPFELGTDGSQYDRLIVRGSGARQEIRPTNAHPAVLEMKGSDVFLFTMRVIPKCIKDLLEKIKLSIDDIDLFVFHQASKLVIDNLVRHLSLNPKKVFTNYQKIGNTVSATIPIALKDAQDQGCVKDGDKVLLVGFGVGLSWGATLIRWSEIL